jgi:K+-transporting ATPase KdpF subunit
MTVESTLGLIVAALALAYLLYSLLRPDRF